MSAAFAMSACSGVKQSMGASKQGPDETAVTARAPLVVPATFDLKPPEPGAPRPQDADAAAAAQRVLGGAPRAAPASAGEKALLAATGAQSADSSVRQELRQEVRRSSKRKSYADTVLFWRGSVEDPGTPLDAGDEAQRVKVARPAAAPVIRKVEKPQAPAETAAEAKEAQKKADEDASDSGGWFDWF
jgi:hypothetical protein